MLFPAGIAASPRELSSNVHVKLVRSEPVIELHLTPFWVITKFVLSKPTDPLSVIDKARVFVESKAVSTRAFLLESKL